jgi:hypothetical protein
MLQKKIIYKDAALAAILFLMVLVIFMLSSCKHDAALVPMQTVNQQSETGNTNNGNTNNGNQQSTCDPDTSYFQTQVLPLLVSNCSKDGCHNSTSHREGIVLDNYSNIMATGNIIPGNAGQSRIYRSLTQSDPEERMPPYPSNSLTSSQINTIFHWIDQGALNNTCSNVCDTTNVTFSGSVFPIIQNSCIGCHSGFNAGGQVDLTTYQNILLSVQNGRLLGSIENNPGFSAMPKGGNKLPDCQIDMVRIWIQNGAVNN